VEDRIALSHSGSLDYNTRMAHVALILWLMVSTLLGPGGCCCSFASLVPNGVIGMTGTPVKSCCDQDATNCGEPGKGHHAPGQPSKCPCKQKSQVGTLPLSTSANADLVAQLKLIDELFVGMLAPVTFEVGTINSGTTNSYEPVLRLAGRDLLAAYCVLRC